MTTNTTPRPQPPAEPASAARSGRPDPGRDETPEPMPARTYRFGRSRLVRSVLECALPAVLLAATVLFWYFVVRPNKGGFLEASLKWWGPFGGGALVLWLVIEIVSAARAFSFAVVVADDAIAVGGTRKRWSEIDRAEVHSGEGTGPAVSLYPVSGECLRVPASIDGREEIVHAVERRVVEVVRKA